MLFSSLNTRRWPRHRVDLPVRIVIPNGLLTSTVAGRATEISGSGMALHSTLGLKPGDLMQVEFPTSNPSGVMAVVRNHKDDCFGVEFLKQLPSRDKTLKSNQTCDPKTLFAGLRRKKLEIIEVQREIEALSLAIPLLADDKRECAESSLPHGSALHRSIGVEFLRQPPRDRTLNKSNQTCDPKTLLAGLRRKQLEIIEVQREIEALNLAIPLLADDKRESAEPSLPLPQRSELDRRPWPSPGPKPAQQQPLSH
jgi:PilZ domain